MRFQVLSSGSAGNMTYIESKDTRLLLDAGISLKEIERRSDIDLSKLDGIIISHEHGDHISNLASIAKKAKCKVFISEASFKKMLVKYPKKYDKLNVAFIEENKKYKIKDINFMPLLLSHDAACCLGFVFVSDKESLAYITDTGFIPIPYYNILNRVNSLIIESNHDIEMLQNSDRDWSLKQRILSVHGHMSNVMCGEVLNKILKVNKLSNVVLAHLSQECNDEKIAVDTIMSLIEGDYIPKIYVAKQDDSIEMLDVK